jgi:hypothetical protein
MDHSEIPARKWIAFVDTIAIFLPLSSLSSLFPIHEFTSRKILLSIEHFDESLFRAPNETVDQTFDHTNPLVNDSIGSQR